MAKNEERLVEVLRFTPYASGKDSGLVGFATIRWGDVAFSGVRLCKNKRTGVHFIAMPSEAGADGKTYYSTVWLAFADKEDAKRGYDMICDAVLDYIENQERKDTDERIKRASRR